MVLVMSTSYLQVVIGCTTRQNLREREREYLAYMSLRFDYNNDFYPRPPFPFPFFLGSVGSVVATLLYKIRMWEGYEDHLQRQWVSSDIMHPKVSRRCHALFTSTRCADINANGLK